MLTSGCLLYLLLQLANRPLMKFFLYTLFAGCAILLSSFSLFSQTSDLIISEYGEGSGWNKYIEIYNGTGADVDLTGHYIEIAFDGDLWNDPTNKTIYLNTPLVNGDVLVICHTSADPAIQANADIITGSLSFNGNDAVGLFSPASIIDVIGQVSFNPGTGWEVAGTNNATAEHTLVRKSTICSPNVNWISSAGTSTSDSEWIVNPQDYWSNLGSHSSACGGVPVPLNAIWIILLFAGSYLLIRRYIG